MKLRAHHVLILLASSFACAHATVTDGGGRDVRVALFTTHEVHSVTLTPLAAGAWTATCAACAHKPLITPIIVTHGEMFAGGTLRVTDADNSASASGLWHLRSRDEAVDVVLTLPSERYVAAVVSAEAAANEPVESLRALAIVARTYALNGSHYTAGPGHLPADLCDSTQCQALRWGAVTAAIEDAVSVTAGETLWFGTTRAEVFFSQHCGGQTADIAEAWAPIANKHNAPYLRSHADAYCLRNGPAAWHTAVTLQEFQSIAQREGWHVPQHITGVSIVQRSVSGRAAKLVVRGASGETSILSASALRFGVGRALGWNRIRSDLYEVALHGNAIVFDGRGHGHGVGLCQAGATEMAREHRDARAILGFYFPGTKTRITSTDDGWIESRTGAVRIRSTHALSSETNSEIARAWQNALQRFPVSRMPEPLVVFAPSSEMYRQMTGRPGWDLASTRGSVVTLQPKDVLRKPRAGGGSEESTLRHELLHVLIESEATDRAPLWLREGLAEALSTDAFTGSFGDESGPQLDDMLLHVQSANAAQVAHGVAGGRVHSLIGRYGLTTVRGWLKSGVPAWVVDAGK